MTNTLNFYNTNAITFSADTLNVDFKKTQDKFLSYLLPGVLILDFGCGSGRDTKYFMDQGYKVDAVDGSEKLCKLASEYTGTNVRCMLFEELDEENRYGGIWACSSILHLPMDQLILVMNKISRAVVKNGIAYTSFKYGAFEGERNGRYFTDMDENKFTHMMEHVNGLHVKELWITSDVRPDRGEEKWLNVILKKN